MNDNHQPANELRNALNHTIPEAEKAFQDNLEEQLMARLQNTSTSQNAEENIMPLFGSKQKRNQHASRLPLTLAAAVLAITIVGGLLFFVQGSADAPYQDTVCEYSGEHHTYRIQEGDTLFAVSEQFGVSFDRLAEANCFDDELTILSVGQLITIPVPHPDEQTNDTRSVIVTTRDIAPGEVITTEMIEVDFRENDTITVIAPVCCEELIVGNTIIEAIEEGMIIEEQMLEDLTFNPIEAENNPRIGIVIGHGGQEPDRGAVCSDGTNELSINQGVAEATRLELIRQNYEVDILLQFDEAINDYNADLLIELHVIGCSDDASDSGFYTGYNNVSGVENLENCLNTYYSEITGLALKPDDLSSSDSYVLRDVAETTPAVILTMGMLNADRNLLVDEQPIIVSGIVSTITCFLPLENDLAFYNGYSPMLIARQDIPLSTIITEDMLLEVLVPNDFMNELQPPLSSFMNVIGSPELAIGQQATALIRQYEPVLMENISQANDCNYDTSCFNLQPGRIAFTLITDNTNILNMTPGQSIDILLPLQLITRFNGENQIVTEAHLPLEVVPELRLESIATDAILLEARPDGENIIVTLALKAPDAIMLERTADSSQNMVFVPHVPEDNTPLSENIVVETECVDTVAGCMLIPDGHVIVSIPLDDPTPLYMEIGAQVDVLAAMGFVDIADDFQAVPDDVNAVIQVEDDLQAIVTNEMIDSESAVNVTLDTVSTDAILIAVDDEATILTLAVSPQDATVLVYLAEANIPMRIVPHVDIPEN